MYTISQLAKAADVTVETVRYYERQQLITQPQKPTQGYRQYPESTLTALLFIKRAQTLGFTLNEINTLIQLNTGSCQDIQQLAENKLQSIQTKISDLKQLEHSLKQLLQACHSNIDENHCPLIESLITN